MLRLYIVSLNEKQEKSGKTEAETDLNFFSTELLNKIWQEFQQSVRFTKVVAKMRICCYGPPTTFIFENVPNWSPNLIFDSGSILLFIFLKGEIHLLLKIRTSFY